MDAVLDPARVPARARPSRLVRLVLALSTNPIPADFTASPPLNAYLAGLARTGWTLRQAYYRNWAIWRNGGEDPRGLIVLPSERTMSGEDDYALFVAIEVLRCTTRRHSVDLSAIARLVPRAAMFPATALVDRYRAAERELTRLQVWR